MGKGEGGRGWLSTARLRRAPGLNLGGGGEQVGEANNLGSKGVTCSTRTRDLEHHEAWGDGAQGQRGSWEEGAARIPLSERA